MSSDLHPFTHTPHALKQLRAAISPVMVSVGIYCNALKDALAQYVGPHQTSGVDSQLLQCIFSLCYCFLVFCSVQGDEVRKGSDVIASLMAQRAKYKAQKSQMCSNLSGWFNDSCDGPMYDATYGTKYIDEEEKEEEEKKKEEEKEEEEEEEDEKKKEEEEKKKEEEEKKKEEEEKKKEEEEKKKEEEEKKKEEEEKKKEKEEKKKEKEEKKEEEEEDEEEEEYEGKKEWIEKKQDKHAATRTKHAAFCSEILTDDSAQCTENNLASGKSMLSSA